MRALHIALIGLLFAAPAQAQWVSGTGINLAAPGPIGATTASTGAFTLLTSSSTLTTSVTTFSATARSLASWGLGGARFQGGAGAIFTDTTVATGTIADVALGAFAADTLAATNTGVIVTNLSLLYLPAPVTGTNVTGTNKWSLLTGGAIASRAGINVTGGPSTFNSGTFSANSNSAQTISLGDGTGAGTVTIGTGTRTGNVTIGNSANTTIIGSPLAPSTTLGIVGTAVADNANAGAEGEFVEAPFTAVAITNNVTANLISISLTAGDWDVEGFAGYAAGANAMTAVVAGVSTTSATLPAINRYSQLTATFPAGGGAAGINAPVTRINVSTTTTVYLVGLALFTPGTMTASGFLRARRVR